MTHGSVAKSVRLNKERQPEKYCGYWPCLYRTDAAFCPKHDKPIYRGGGTACNSVSEKRIAEEARKQ